MSWLPKTDRRSSNLIAEPSLRGWCPTVHVEALGRPGDPALLDDHQAFEGRGCSGAAMVTARRRAASQRFPRSCPLEHTEAKLEPDVADAVTRAETELGGDVQDVESTRVDHGYTAGDRVEIEP
jgi:hypothetical protein